MLTSLRIIARVSARVPEGALDREVSDSCVAHLSGIRRTRSLVWGCHWMRTAVTRRTYGKGFSPNCCLPRGRLITEWLHPGIRVAGWHRLVQDAPPFLMSETSASAHALEGFQEFSICSPYDTSQFRVSQAHVSLFHRFRPGHEVMFKHNASVCVTTLVKHHKQFSGHGRFTISHDRQMRDAS